MAKTASARSVNFGFVLLMGYLVAASALAVDAMLSSLPKIGQELSPENLNLSNLVIGLYFAGVGLGTLVWGPVSDAIGRKNAIIIALLLYSAASLWASVSGSIEILLCARVVQGFAAASMRIVSNAIVRDMYEGRAMARVASFISMIFVFVPGVAPLIGYLISNIAGWRGVFIAFVVFAGIGLVWFVIAQPETLPKERRRPLRPSVLWNGICEVFASAHNRRCISIQALVFAGFASLLTLIHPIFDQIFGRPDSFAYYMGAGSLIGGIGSILNIRLVEKFGMIKIIQFSFTLYIAISILFFCMAWFDSPFLFWAFLVWMVASFMAINVLMANIVALALQPVPHLAGLAGSIQLATGSFAGMAMSVFLAVNFAGSVLPLVTTIIICSVLSLWITTKLTESPYVAA